MSDWSCSCTPYDLRTVGCKCRNKLPRTLPFNFMISVAGWRKIYKWLMREIPMSNWPSKTPDCEEDLLIILFELERDYPDLYDTLARSIERNLKSGRD